MKTLPIIIRNPRALKRTTLLSALLITLALVASFQNRSAATADSTTTESTIVLDTNAAPLIDGTFQVVSKHMQTHFGTDARQCLSEEMRRAHPRFEGAKRMLDGLSAQSGRFWRSVQAILHHL